MSAEGAALAQDSQAWRERMECLELGPDVFYPDDPEDPKQSAAAKAICEQCVVVEECLNYALLTREKFGIVGGLTPKERAKIIRQKQRQPKNNS